MIGEKFVRPKYGYFEKFLQKSFFLKFLKQPGRINNYA